MHSKKMSDETYIVLIANNFKCSKEMAELLLKSAKDNELFDILKDTLIGNNKDKRSEQNV